MGIIECKLDDSYKQNEMKKEIKMKEDENSLCVIEYNNPKIKVGIKESEFIDEIKTKNNLENINTKYEKYMNMNKIEKNSNKENSEKDLKLKNDNTNNNTDRKNNMEKKIFKLRKDNQNIEDDLIIITPRNKLIYESNNNNDITDEHTIKNETLVYVFENKYNSNEEKSNENNNNNNNSDLSKNKSRNKMITNNNNYNNISKTYKNSNESKSNNTKRKVITKKLNLNNDNKKKDINEIENNNKPKSYNKNKKNIKNLKNKMNNINNINNINNLNENNNINFKSYNNIKNNFIPPLFSSFLINTQNKNQQTSTLENQNIQLKNIILKQLKEEILPNVERKTYQEDLYLFKGKNLSFKDNIYNDSKDNILKLDNQYYNQLYTEQNKYLIFNNNDNKIVDKLKDIYKALYIKNNNNNIKNNDKKIYKKMKNELKSKSPNNQYINQNIPIYRKETDIHIRNKSYNNNINNNNFSINENNNNNNNNSYFSLFNNSTNLSINFINNKCNKTAKIYEKGSSILNKRKKNFEGNYKTTNDIYKNESFNPFLNYNNFNKNNNKKNIKNKSYIKKVKPLMCNSKSCNNIFINNEKTFNYSNVNNFNLLSQQYRDLIEVDMPKKDEESLININILKNKIGNKYIFSYKKINNFNNDMILYDGVIYKVIDNIDNEDNDNENDNEDNSNNNKYKLLERYFQITKNCFKYYNNINEAINEKDKPLVQFDIRYIQSIDILDNNFLENYKINEENDIEIIFCIYINLNNDFFVFAHDNNNFGNNIINILEFLKRYYEDR